MLGLGGTSGVSVPSEIYLVSADGERDNITVMRDVLRAMGEPEDAFDWVRDRPGHDRRYAIDSAKPSMRRYHSLGSSCDAITVAHLPSRASMISKRSMAFWVWCWVSSYLKASCAVHRLFSLRLSRFTCTFPLGHHFSHETTSSGIAEAMVSIRIWNC